MSHDYMYHQYYVTYIYIYIYIIIGPPDATTASSAPRPPSWPE